MRWGRPALTEALREGTATKAWPLESGGELALLGDLATATEAVATIVKTNVAFMGIARFSRWRRAFVVRRPVCSDRPNYKEDLSYVEFVNGLYFYSLMSLRGFCCFGFFLL